MNTHVDLYSDGSAYKSRAPTYGWLAVEDGALVAEGSGCCRDDGMRSGAGEIRGAFDALKWAEAQGYTSAAIHSDYKGLPYHFNHGLNRPGSHAEAATLWLRSQTSMTISFHYRDETDPWLNLAHKLTHRVAPHTPGSIRSLRPIPQSFQAT